MIRLFKSRDLGRTMETWLEGNLSVYPFAKEEYWRRNFGTVRSMLPNAEVYVFEKGGEIQGFVGMDVEHIAEIFIAEGHQGQGVGHQLISEVKRKKRLSPHVYEKNTDAVVSYQAEGFRIENSMTEKETGEQEYPMVSYEGSELNEGA